MLVSYEVRSLIEVTYRTSKKIKVASRQNFCFFISKSRKRKYRLLFEDMYNYLQLLWDFFEFLKHFRWILNNHPFRSILTPIRSHSIMRLILTCRTNPYFSHNPEIHTKISIYSMSIYLLVNDPYNFLAKIWSILPRLATLFAKKLFGINIWSKGKSGWPSRFVFWW